MDFWAAARRNTGDIEKDKASTLGKRRYGRIRCSLAHSTVGDIQDLSGGGMRVLSRMKFAPGQTVAVTILTHNGPVALSCKVAWIKRVKFFWFEAGLEFANADDQLRKVIGEFARFAADQEVLRPTIQSYIDDSNRQAG